MSVRVCHCGCGTDMTGRHPKAKYATDACRAAHWKERHNYGRHDAAAPRTNGSASSSKVSGLQVSYRRVVAALAEELERLGAKDPAGRAEQVVMPALSDRQRARAFAMKAGRR